MLKKFSVDFQKHFGRTKNDRLLYFSRVFHQFRERSEIRGGGLQIMGEGHDFCALRKRGIQFLQLSLRGGSKFFTP